MEPRQLQLTVPSDRDSDSAILRWFTDVRLHVMCSKVWNKPLGHWLNRYACLLGAL